MMFAAQCYDAMVSGVIQQLEDEKEYVSKIKEILYKLNIDSNVINIIISYIDLENCSKLIN